MLLKGNLQGIQHIGIPVIDINEAKRWYEDVLGFQTIHEKIINPEGREIKVAFLKLSDIILELYQLSGKELEEVKTRGHGHIDHFAIKASDVVSALCEAISKGAKVDNSTPYGPVLIKHLYPKGTEYVNLVGPTRERVQLEQRFDLKAKNSKANLIGLSHIGIVVSDMEKSKKFYKQFGFKEVAKTKIKKGEDETIIIVLNKNGVNIQLIQPTGEKLEEVKSRKDGHINHIAFDVIDVEKAFKELKDNGIETIEEKPVFLPFWERGIKYFNILGPDGERLEFSEKL
ncbi:MAG: VOC family protein [Clostridiaceae bacterium]